MTFDRVGLGIALLVICLAVLIGAPALGLDVGEEVRTGLGALVGAVISFFVGVLMPQPPRSGG
jgi:hypothetical protein